MAPPADSELKPAGKLLSTPVLAALKLGSRMGSLLKKTGVESETPSV